jgi:4-amino-4-deoxy-L-arabinose transferase-like glycosyltransferase
VNRRRDAVWLSGLVVVGLVLRLVFVLFVDTRPKFSGGDGGFYLTVAQNIANGYGFVYGQLATYKTEPVLTSGPLYPAYLSAFYVLFGGFETHPIHDPPIPFLRSDPWILAARLGQAVLGALTIAAVYLLARRLWGARGGLLAAGVMAFDPRFIVETGAVYTETLFTCLLMAGLALYVIAHQRASTRWYVLAWAVLGLAVLARPIALVIVPALALHLWLTHRPARALRESLVLAGMVALVLVPWVTWHYLRYGDFSILGSSPASHFWLGVIHNGQWEGLDAYVDDWLAMAGGDPNNPPYLRAALAVIAQNPIRFLQLLALKLARAYLQPAGTVFFAGPSLKSTLVEFVAGRAGLAVLVGDVTFWPKLAMYVFHFGTIALGLAAMWRTRNRWRETLPLALAIAVVSATYMLLTLIPRYLFPIMPLFTVFAAEALPAAWAKAALGLSHLARLPGKPAENPFRQGRV